MKYCKKRNTALKIDKYTILFLLILCAGSFLRFYKIEKDSLWFDELGTWETIRSDIQLSKYPLNTFTFWKEKITPAPRATGEKLHNITENVAADSIHLPLYFYCIYFIKMLFGDSAFALRLLSVLSGILSIIFIYLLTKILYNRETALISSAMMSFLWFPVYYSQEARMYAPMILFTLLSSYLFVLFYKNITEKNRFNLWLAGGYLCAGIVNSWLHLFTFYFTALQSLFFLCLLLGRKNRNRSYCIKVIVLYLVQLSCVIPIIWKGAAILTGFSQIPNMQWLPRYNQLKWENIFLPFNSFLNYPVDFPSFLKPAFYKTSIVRDLVIALILFSLFRQYDRCVMNGVSLRSWIRLLIKREINTVIVSAWFIVPLIVLFIISLVKIPMYIDRYLLFSLPPLYMLAAHLFNRLTHNKIIRVFAVSAFLIVILIDLFVWKDFYRSANKIPVKTAVQSIMENMPPDGRAFAASNLGSFGLEYYFRECGLEDMPLIYLQDNYTEPYTEVRSSRYTHPAVVEKELHTLKSLIHTGKYRYIWYFDMFPAWNSRTIPVLDFPVVLRKEYLFLNLYLFRIYP